MKTHEPAIIFLDLHLPDMSGLEVLKVRDESELWDCKIIVVTYDESPILLLQVMRYKVNAIILKSYTLAEIANAVTAATVSHEMYLDPSLKSTLMLANQSPPLSPKEFQVIEYLAQGLTYQNIATQLGVSKDTIKTYRARIVEKIHLRSRAEMRDWFYRGSNK